MTCLVEAFIIFFSKMWNKLVHHMKISIKLFLLIFIVLHLVDSGWSSPMPVPVPGGGDWNCGITTMHKKKAVPGRCYSYQQCQWKGIGDYDLEVVNCPKGRVFDENISECVNEKVLGFDFDKTRCDSSNDKLLSVKPIKPIKKQVAVSQSVKPAVAVPAAPDTPPANPPPPPPPPPPSPTKVDGDDQSVAVTTKSGDDGTDDGNTTPIPQKKALSIDEMMALSSQSVSELKSQKEVLKESVPDEMIVPNSKPKVGPKMKSKHDVAVIKQPNFFQPFNNFPVTTRSPRRTLTHEAFVKPYKFASKHRVGAWPKWEE